MIMTCKDLENWAADYLSGDLSQDKQILIIKHLEECDSCKQTISQLETCWHELEEIPQATPGPEMRSRFYTMLAEEKVRMQNKHSVYLKFNTWLESWWPRKPIIQLGFTTLIAFVSIFVFTQIQNHQTQNTSILTMRQEVLQMRQSVSTVLLEHDAAQKRIQGIQMIKQVSQPDASLLESLLYHINHDPNVNVRLAAIDAIYLYNTHQEVQNHLSSSLQNQSSPLVQIALIDLISDIRTLRAGKALEILIQDQSVEIEVRNHAQSRLNNMM